MAKSLSEGRGLSRIDDIIDSILTSERYANSRAFKSSRVFGDEPILRKGSQARGYLPEKYLEMRRLLSSPAAYSWSRDRRFYEQAKFMEDFEDDYPYTGTFSQYYPTYLTMSDSQLRGYFSWRTRYRRGERPKTNTSFLFVHAYELLSGVGTHEGTQGFHDLETLLEAYRVSNPAIVRHISSWLIDYAALYDLDRTLLKPYTRDGHAHSIRTLESFEQRFLGATPPGKRRKPVEDWRPYTQEARTLLEALSSLSSYKVEKSRFLRDNKDDAALVTFCAFDRLALRNRGARTTELVEGLFGGKTPHHHKLFSTAVSWTPMPEDDRVYEVSDTMTYQCSRGVWYVSSYKDGEAPNKWLGLVLRTVDFELRRQTNYASPIMQPKAPKYLLQIVEREVKDYLAWKSAHTPRKIEIDYSSLARIREASAGTRESLLTDEERFEEASQPSRDDTPSQKQKNAAQAIPDASGQQSSVPLVSAQGAALDIDLTEEQTRLLVALCKGRKPDVPAGTTTELLADAINEALFDLAGDTVIEFDENGDPRVIEDYLNDVESYLGLR